MKILKYFIILTIITSYGCNDYFDVEYKNRPDITKVLSNQDDVYGLAGGLFFNWYQTQYYSYTYTPVMALWVMSDQGTSSWLNGGMYDLSLEPRQAFNNNETYDRYRIIGTYYSSMYGTIWQANDILTVINNGMEIGELNSEGKGKDTEMVKAMSYFTEGIGFGYLGLVFDKAFITTSETPNPGLIAAQPYADVIDSAIVNLDRCIEICENNSFTIPSDWINGSQYSNVELAQLARSYAARFLVYEPRTKAENDNVNWTQVLEYAQNGIQRDCAPYMDNVVWKNYFFHYTVSRDNWVRIDARIIHLMDNSYPERYPDLSVESAPGEASSADARLLTDFKYQPTCQFKPERGYYHYSNYEYKRYPYTFSDPDNVVEFSLAENDLIIAEAKFHLGDKAGAVNILNAGTRTTRGNLPALDAGISDDEFLSALFYERDIELIMTGFGISFFDMRRRDMLQKGTLLHFPIPAKELNILGNDVYTFGGVENADGIGTSNGGWYENIYY